MSDEKIAKKGEFEGDSALDRVRAATGGDQVPDYPIEVPGLPSHAELRAALAEANEESKLLRAAAKRLESQYKAMRKELADMKAEHEKQIRYWVNEMRGNV